MNFSSHPNYFVADINLSLLLVHIDTNISHTERAATQQQVRGGSMCSDKAGNLQLHCDAEQAVSNNGAQEAGLFSR